MPYIQKKQDGLIFKIFVLPRSSKNMISGIYGDAVKLKLTAPPVDGAANKMCVKFLAKHLNIPKSCLEIVSGHASRTKVVLVRLPDGKDARKDKERKRITYEVESFFKS
jgi:uncharacterized protein (TIGR00251 family)